MKKIASFIFTLMLLLLVIHPSTAGQSFITLEKATSTLLQDNTLLKKIDLEITKAEEAYNETLTVISDIEKGRYPVYDSYGEMVVKKQKELYPEQAKLNLEIAKNKKITTERSLIIGLRYKYSDLMNADNSLDIKRKRLELVKKAYADDEKSLEQGAITGLQLEQSAYNVLKAEKEVDAAVRYRENICRNLNWYIGEHLQTQYAYIELPIEATAYKLEALEYYVDKAIKERHELLEMQRDIELKKLNLSIVEEGNLHLFFPKAATESDNITKQLLTAEINLENLKMDIEIEIRGAYLDIEAQRDTIEQIKKQLETKNKVLTKLEDKPEIDASTKDSIDQLKVDIDELVNSLESAEFSYSTKLMKLDYAAGLGPAF